MTESGKRFETPWQTHNMWGEGKNKLAECVPVGRVVISLGWTLQGSEEKRI